MADQPVLYMRPEADLSYLIWLRGQYARDLRFAWQERVENTAFVTAESADLAWPTGRLFGPDVELRWQKLDDDRYALQILTEAIALAPTGEGWQEHRFDDRKSDTLFLRGEHRRHRAGAKGDEPDEWVEAITPVALRYPIRPKRFARLEVVHYRKDGMVVLTRMKEVAPYE